MVSNPRRSAHDKVEKCADACFSYSCFRVMRFTFSSPRMIASVFVFSSLDVGVLYCSLCVCEKVFVDGDFI